MELMCIHLKYAVRKAKEFEGPFDWLEKIRFSVKMLNLQAIETPLEANIDRFYFKAFISDIGLLMAIMINKSKLPLYYFSRGSEHLEIDFIFESNSGITLLEEKSVNGKMSASRAVMEGRTPYKAEVCYKVIRNNFGIGDFYISVPHYAIEFLLNDIYQDLEKGTEFSPLNYPDIK